MAQNAEKLAAKPDKSLAREVARLAGRHLDKIVEIAGGDDALGEENVHDMRVATRRFREVVKIQRDIEGSRKLKRIHSFARDFGNQLGIVRGLDVLHKGLAALRQEDSLRSIILATDLRRREERERLTNVIRSKQFKIWIENARRAFRKPSKKGPTPHEVANHLIDKTLESLNRYKNIRPDDDFAKLHALRIEAKHARYRLEFFNFAPVQEFDHAIELLSALQDHLGSLHDDVVLRDELKSAIDSGIEWSEVEQAAIEDSIHRLDETIRQGRREAEAKWGPVIEPASIG